MKLSSNDLNDLCVLAVEAARLSGAMIQSYSGANVTAENKASGSSQASQVVTHVDLKSQELILQHLKPSFRTFDLGLLIEESEDDLSRFEKDYFWCVDPLDGTLPFVKQQPGYSVSVALVSRDGVAVLGVVYNPLNETLYHAIQGCGAYRNEMLWTLDANATTTYTEISAGGAVINACSALEAAPAYFMKKPKPQEGGGCLWDYAATTCLYEEIGAFARDSHGDPLDLNARDSLYMNRKGVLFASHQTILDQTKIKRSP